MSIVTPTERCAGPCKDGRMRATTLHAPGDIRVSEVPDPTIKLPTDAIVKVYRGLHLRVRPVALPRREPDPSRARPSATSASVKWSRSVPRSRRSGPGDFVIVPFCHCDNTCVHCQAGMQSVCTNLGMTVSGQAEFARVTQADGSLVRTDSDPDAAMTRSLLALTDVMATGWHAAVAAGVPEGGTAVVVGDGAVGLCGVLAASVMGAEKIVAMSRHESRQKVATEFGATHIVAARGKEGEAEVAEITGGVGADAVLECVGTDAAMGTAFTVARPGATVGLRRRTARRGAAGRQDVLPNVGLAGGMAPVRRYLPELLDLVTSGRIDPGRVFDAEVPLDQVADGYRAMDQREAIKVVVIP